VTKTFCNEQFNPCRRKPVSMADDYQPYFKLENGVYSNALYVEAVHF
jgi:hypothetical protein